MCHVQDRWWKDVGNDELGKAIRVRTPEFGKGLRYRVGYLDLHGDPGAPQVPHPVPQHGAYAQALCNELDALVAEREAPVAGLVDLDAAKRVIEDPAARGRTARVGRAHPRRDAVPAQPLARPVPGARQSLS